MATKKSPSRGTGSRPAKATAAVGKPRTASKKPLKVSADPVTQGSESNVVTLTASEASVSEPASIVEAVAETPATEPEPTPVAEIVKTETVAATAEPETDEPEIDEPEIDETVEETKLDAIWPFGFSSASLFQGFPQLPQFSQLPEFPSFGAVDMDACVASGTALAEGMRNFGEEVMAFSRKTAERNVETTMAMFGASSVEEVVALQQSYAKGSVDDMLNESAKLTGMAIDVANKAAAPFTRF